jgi:hypothetical protein
MEAMWQSVTSPHTVPADAQREQFAQLVQAIIDALPDKIKRDADSPPIVQYVAAILTRTRTQVA